MNCETCQRPLPAIVTGLYCSIGCYKVGNNLCTHPDCSRVRAKGSSFCPGHQGVATNNPDSPDYAPSWAIGPRPTQSGKTAESK